MTLFNQQSAGVLGAALGGLGAGLAPPPPLSLGQSMVQFQRAANQLSPINELSKVLAEVETERVESETRKQIKEKEVLMQRIEESRALVVDGRVAIEEAGRFVMHREARLKERLIPLRADEGETRAMALDIMTDESPDPHGTRGRAYDAACSLLNGKRVVDIEMVFRGMMAPPALAFAPIWEKEVRFGAHDGKAAFGPAAHAYQGIVSEPYLTLPLADFYNHVNYAGHDAQLPPIPGRMQKYTKGRHSKENPGEYFLLWEPHWVKVPDPDPAVLRHISGRLYEVVDTWDFSPLEAAILGI